MHDTFSETCFLPRFCPPIITESYKLTGKEGIVGFVMDLIKLAAYKAEYKCVGIVSIEFDALIPVLQQGK